MKYLSIIALCILVFSCTPAKESKEEKVDLKEKVMEIHDEVMPKMGELRKAKKALEEKMKDADSTMQVEYRVMADKLQEANESMMIWMRNFNPNPEGTEEEIDAYLKEQMKSIGQVKEDMLNSLENAKKIAE